jgi:cytosine/adenosine deaminase-related metal-dependent hydrolase
VWRWSVPLYHSHSPAEQRLAAQLAALSMLKSGTTCFLEAGTILALDEVHDGLAASGIRGRIGQWVLDRSDDPEQQTASTDRALRRLDDELARYPGGDGQRLAAWPLLIGHSTASDALWQGAKQLADAHGAGVAAHMSPVEVDPDWYLARCGRRPILHLAAHGVLGDNVILTHAVHLDDSEIALLASSGAAVAHCPGAALKCGFGLAGHGRFPELAAAGVPLLLGSDGADHADLWTQARLVASIFKDARRDTSLFPAAEALAMATRNGARALGLADQIGQIKVGFQADLVMHDTQRPEWQPLNNIPAQLVWSADGRSVHSVWVDGRRVVDSYRCTTLDEERLYADAAGVAAGLRQRCGLPDSCPWPVT